MALQDGVNRGALPSYEESMSQHGAKLSVHFNPQAPSFIPPPSSIPSFQQPSFSGGYYQSHTDYPNQTGPAFVQVTTLPESPPQTVIYRIRSNRRACCSGFISLIMLIIFIIVLVEVIIPAFNRMDRPHHNMP